jgi:hypothetical protein
LAISKIAIFFGVSKATLKQALKHHRIPERRSLKKSGKYIDRLEKLNVGDSVEMRVPGKHPQVVLRKSAKSAGIAIALRSLGDDSFKITRVEMTKDRHLPKLARINKEQLVELYSEQRLTVSQIAKIIGCNEAIIYQARRLHKIPQRPRLKTGGKFVTLFRNLEAGENIEVHCPTKYPAGNLHMIARQAGIRISIRKIEADKFKVTKIGFVKKQPQQKK